MKKILIILAVFLFFVSCVKNKKVNVVNTHEIVPELKLNTSNKELIFYFVSENRAIDSIEIEDISYARKGIKMFDYIKIGLKNESNYIAHCLLFSKIHLIGFEHQNKIFDARHFWGSNFAYQEIVYSFSNITRKQSKYEEAISSAEVDPGHGLSQSHIVFDSHIEELSVLLLYQDFLERDNHDHDKTAMNKLLNSGMEKILAKHGLME